MGKEKDINTTTQDQPWPDTSPLSPSSEPSSLTAASTLRPPPPGTPPRTYPATSVFITTTKREGLKSARSKPCPVSGFRSATRNANSKTFPSDTTLSQPTHATSQTTTQLPQSTTNLPHVHVFYVVYMTFYVICHILNSCMPNWQQLAMEGGVMASLPDDGHDGQTTACRLRGQTEYLI